MTVLHRRARTRPSGPFRSRRAPHSRPVPGLNKRPNCIPEGTAERGFRTDGSEAAPPHLGARCRSQIGSYAPAAPVHSGKSTCDTYSHRRTVASLRNAQMQAVVREWFDAPPPRGVLNGRVKCLSGRDAGASRSSPCLTLVWLLGSFAPWCTITCTRTAEKSRVGLWDHLRLRKQGVVC